MIAKVSALLLAVLITIGALMAASYAVASIQVSGMVPSNFTAADIVRQRCPLHFVRPEWIKSADQTDILFRWVEAETKARLLMVCAGWLVANVLVMWRYWRSWRPERTA